MENKNNNNKENDNCQLPIVNCQFKPADRLAGVSEYYFSRKLKEVAEMNAEGMDVISLGIGSPDMPPSEETIRTLCQAANNPDGHGYMPYVGIPELRQAFADWYRRWYGVSLDPKTEIQPLIGSKEGILHVTLAFVNPGERVLVPNPGYPTYTSLSKLLGAEVVPYDLKEEDGWMPDWDGLEAMDTKGVRLMWTNYPNMPTGAPATPELYERLVDFARRRGIVIVNDNPYSFILNDHPLSILAVPGAKDCCIEFNSMSKSHNMPGWRIGMLASNAQFVQWPPPRPWRQTPRGTRATTPITAAAAPWPKTSCTPWAARSTRGRPACSSGAASPTYIIM